MSTDAPTPPNNTYAALLTSKPKRVWLATLVCGIVAPVAVTIVALFILLVAQIFSPFSSLMSSDHSAPVQGSLVAIVLCLYNLVVFPIVVPVTWGGLALTLGRLRWKGHRGRKSYYVRSVLLGAGLVALTAGIFGSLDGSFVTGSAAAITGGIIGALAGMFCALIFLLISRPGSIVGQVEVEAFS